MRKFRQSWINLSSQDSSELPYWYRFADYELRTQVRGMCVVTNEPFLYRLKRD